MLSLRHKRDDYFWFSFFHEAGQILLGKKKAIFLDEMNDWTDPEEDLANEFASNFLQHENVISWQSLNGLTRRFELIEACS
jgi:Zn-dependent peptidase ImmA (M78 family)